MNLKHLGLATGLALASLSADVLAQQTEGLGKLHFPVSCDPKVHTEFDRGVAMIHSYWFTIARKTFENVLSQDPNCAMAHWGIALDALGNVFLTSPIGRTGRRSRS